MKKLPQKKSLCNLFKYYQHWYDMDLFNVFSLQKLAELVAALFRQH